MNFLSRLCLLLLISSAGLSLSAFQTPAEADLFEQGYGQSIRIADLVQEYISLSYDGREEESSRTQARISTREATFIKVHFEYFNIPDNLMVVVSNPEGTEFYRYSNEKRDDYTFDRELGEDGVTRFASMSITGPEAVIRLVATGSVDWSARRGHGVVISQYMEGYSDDLIRALTGESLFGADGPDTRSTCGTNQRSDAACYQSSHPTEFDRSHAVARLLVSGSLCTAWRVGSGNHMFTNNHCMSSSSAVASSESWFNYQRTTCGGSLGTNVKVAGNSMYKTDYTLDYTLYSVNNFSTITSFGNLGLDVRAAVSGEEIYIPQHGSGNPKELAIESDQNTGNVCRVDQASTNGRGTNTDIGYYCDTIGGSSGSPVLARSSHKVLALHHLGGCTNKGAKMVLIWPQVSTYFGGVIPQGSGGGTPTNQAPNASFTSSTNGLTVTFTDQSTDSDGTIVSRAWNFGDGSTSTATNPSHTYASAGTFTVTLTVTDDDGATGNTSAQVTVSSGTGGGVTTLTNGQSVSSLAATSGNWLHYKINLPAGATNLVVSISGGSGDADLYTRFGSQPTTSTYDCRPYLGGNNESCSVASPQTGDYYIGIRAYTTFSGVTLTASFTPPSTGGTGGGGTVTGISGSTGAWQHYYLDVPAGMSTFDIDISGGTGDADLYVRFGAQPTLGSWDYRPYLFGNNESVTVNNPQAGRWYISIYAYSTYSGVTLNAFYNP